MRRKVHNFCFFLVQLEPQRQILKICPFECDGTALAGLRHSGYLPRQEASEYAAR